ncbi:hypothetical protein [Wukongibacter sp. M2B1]|uniref:hypothetical protein n=1 Tax=Wukongibacter sp. M2B1 TaxID=3088895 RepID=UPI003D7B095F
MDEKKILEKIYEYCSIGGNKKYLDCAVAFKIAGKLNVDISTIGQLCNKEKIKISKCQLGCFSGKEKKF